MKKLFLSFLLMLLPTIASAETVEIDGIWYNLVSKVQEAEVTKNPRKYKGNIEIPISVNYNDVEYSVTSIGESAFRDCNGLISVTIPSSIKSIGQWAFALTGTLTSVTFPKNLTSIGMYAFCLCNGLTSITIPDGITNIEGAVFMECRGLTSVTIPNSVEIIGADAFYGCSSLTSIDIPNSVANIEGEAFYGCSSLTSLTIPSSVASIGTKTFKGCSSLTTINIPNSITSIGEYAFDGCRKLTSIAIPKGVKLIGEQAFANCDELTDVYCMAEILSKVFSWSYYEGLYTYPNAFQNSYPQAMTLHVPAAFIESYRSMEPWSLFKAIAALEDGDNPEIKKCATPEIIYANGKVSLSCETEGVDFISEVIVADAKKYYESEFTLSQTYKITVYATKVGYENSDVATREIVVEKEQTTLFGDLDKDGKVNVADHVKLSDIIMNQ